MSLLQFQHLSGKKGHLKHSPALMSQQHFKLCVCAEPDCAAFSLLTARTRCFCNWITATSLRSLTASSAFKKSLTVVGWADVSCPSEVVPTIHSSLCSPQQFGQWLCSISSHRLVNTQRTMISCCLRNCFCYSQQLNHVWLLCSGTLQDIKLSEISEFTAAALLFKMRRIIQVYYNLCLSFC